MKDIDRSHPLRAFFEETIQESLRQRLGLKQTEEVEDYLAQMLVHFLNFDGIFAIKNASGLPVSSVVEMLAEGDIRQNADSFDREREVHRHIGDFLLFWSGIFPEYLKGHRAYVSSDLLVDVIHQGQHSYHIVSTFDHGKYTDEAPVFKKLSEEFDAYREGLNLVRASFKGLSDFGFQA